MTIDDVIDDLTEIICHPMAYGLDTTQLRLLRGARRQIELASTGGMLEDDKELSHSAHLTRAAV